MDNNYAAISRGLALHLGADSSTYIATTDTYTGRWSRIVALENSTFDILDGMANFSAGMPLRAGGTLQNPYGFTRLKLASGRIIVYSMGAVTIASNPTVYDDATTSWLTNVSNVSGTVNLTTINAFDTFLRGLKTDLIWNKLGMLWIPAGNWNASSIAQKLPNANGVVTRFNFASGDYTQPTGYQSDGLTKYVNFNCSPRTICGSTQIGTFGFYSHTTTAIDGADFGAVTNLNNQALSLWTRWTDDTLYAYSWDFNDTIGNRSFANTNASGLWVINRTATNSQTISRNGVIRDTNTNLITSTTPTNNLYGFCFNNNGIPSEFSNRRNSLYFGGANFTNTDITNFWNRVQTLYAAIGRSL